MASKTNLEAYASFLEGNRNREIDLPFRDSQANFRFIDLFAGIGGMRLGFSAWGGECVFSSEWDSHSQNTYKENFDEVPKGDITLIPPGDIPTFDILLAGFPCQPFSSIGQRQGFQHETQGTLFFEIEKILEHHSSRGEKPAAFLLENVKGLVSHDGGNTLKVILQTLRSLGYRVWAKVLDSADFGLPQSRERIYIVGLDETKFGPDAFQWPKTQEHKVGIGEYLESDVEGYSISRHLQKSYIFKKEDGKPQIVHKESTIQVKTLVASYHKIQRISGTFVADGETGLRLLTESECKAVMGFPQDFKVPVSRTQMYRQFGNSVAVPVIRAIAREIIEALGV